MERKCHFVTVIISCCFVRIVINVFLAFFWKGNLKESLGIRYLDVLEQSISAGLLSTQRIQ